MGDSLETGIVVVSLDSSDKMAAVAPKVLVIGAGPAGIAQMCTLSEAGLDVTCYERGSEIGGLWTWNDAVGDDVHQSMYQYHQTNGLNEMLELPEYSFLEHFGHAITSYPPRAVMLDYLQGWAAKCNIDVTLNRRVVQVTYNAETSKFNVISETTEEADRFFTAFDYVVVATGHFSTPNHIAHYPGMEDYDGKVIHAHNFRDAKRFGGKRVLVVGSGYSGEDIAMQCAKFGAAQCTVCHRTTPMGHNFGDLKIDAKEVPDCWDKATKEFVFKDGWSYHPKRTCLQTRQRGRRRKTQLVTTTRTTIACSTRILKRQLNWLADIFVTILHTLTSGWMTDTTIFSPTEIKLLFRRCREPRV